MLAVQVWMTLAVTDAGRRVMTAGRAVAARVEGDSERGASIIETALITALVAALAIGVVAVIGVTVNNWANSTPQP
jgi:Flp pilus assembly pilin Flp